MLQLTAQRRDDSTDDDMSDGWSDGSSRNIVVEPTPAEQPNVITTKVKTLLEHMQCMEHQNL